MMAATAEKRGRNKYIARGMVDEELEFPNKIKKEYGDFKIWRYIYSWNKDDIGDNPNLIYPYNFLNLQKEKNETK